MERNQAIAVAVGVGAVGTALAYLGYSAYHQNDDTNNLVEKESWFSSLFKNSNTETPHHLEPPPNELKVEETVTDKVETQLKEDASSRKKGSSWGQFWKGEYDKGDVDQNVVS